MVHPGTPGIGQRIQVTGNRCAGKSSLAEKLAQQLCVPFVELDALHWEPNWVGLSDVNPQLFRARIWVVAGSYTGFSQAVFWPRLETLIWLDLPRWLLLVRLCKRSWRRSRSKELLWGSNREQFWSQFKLWHREDSLVWWIWTQHARKRRQMLAIGQDPRWAHIRVIRLGSVREVSSFLRSFAAYPGQGGDQA